MKVINGENLILGRVASYIAKEALLGQEIALVNCEKMIITGSKKEIVDRQLQAMQRGHPYAGPFFYRRPDAFVKRAIKRMLPYKKSRGEQALKKIKCYISIPTQFEKATLETLPKANITKVPNLKYIVIQDLCQKLGAQWKK
ncbi:50S ribosomal protein L13 [Nanoarchaeota archaeon]